MLTEVDLEEWEDQYAFLAALAKSADWVTRECAASGLDQLNRIAAVGLVKVGPKGYEHGWIFVGPQAAGGRVFHPEHGHGTVSRSGKRTVGVRFDNGKEHAFEHTPTSGRAGTQSGHFAERISRRATPETPAVPDHSQKPARPKVPKAAKPRAPGESRRGDLAVIHTQTLVGTRTGRGKTEHRYEVGTVTSVTRDGKPKAFRPAGDTHDTPTKYLDRNQSITTMPSEHVNTQGVVDAAVAGRRADYLRAHRYESRADLEQALAPHRIATPAPDAPGSAAAPSPEAPQPKSPTYIQRPTPTLPLAAPKKPAARSTKPRVPKPYKEPRGLEPGAQVTWTHDYGTSGRQERTGRVWSLAPTEGGRQAAWVIPDKREPTDPYSAIAVRRGRRSRGGDPNRLFASNNRLTTTGSMTHAASSVAARHRAMGKAFGGVDLNVVLSEAGVMWLASRRAAA